MSENKNQWHIFSKINIQQWQATGQGSIFLECNYTEVINFPIWQAPAAQNLCTGCNARSDHRGKSLRSWRYLSKTWQSESHFTRELKNQSHSHANATTFMHYYFVFSQHKRLTFNLCNVLPVLQYSILKCTISEEEDTSRFNNAGKLFFSVHL